MTTPSKHAANRANALRSTGPKSAAGQAASSKNALRHGLLSRDVVLGDEDGREFDAFTRALRRSLAPVGAVERALSGRAIAAAWRLRRVERIETLMLEAGRKNWRGEEVGLNTGFVGYCVNGDVFSKLSRYEAGIERAFLRALHELQRLQAARLGRELSAPAVVDVDVSVTPAPGSDSAPPA